MISLAATIVVVPESTVRTVGTLSWLGGAVLLSGWLIYLLFTVSKAPDWGWDRRAAGLIVAAAALALAWVKAEGVPGTRSSIFMSSSAAEPG